MYEGNNMESNTTQCSVFLLAVLYDLSQYYLIIKINYKCCVLSI